MSVWFPVPIGRMKLYLDQICVPDYPLSILFQLRRSQGRVIPPVIFTSPFIKLQLCRLSIPGYNFFKNLKKCRAPPPPAVAKKLGNPYLRTHVLTSTDQLLLILIFWYFAKQAILLSKSTFLSLPLRQGLPEQVFWLLVGVYSWRVVHIFKCIVANFSPPLVMK